MDRDTKISMRMSTILRHRALDYGLTVDSAGYIPIEQLLPLISHQNVTKDDIVRIVAQNNKQRFHILDNKIRANQGHSKLLQSIICSEDLLEKILEPIQGLFRKS